MYCLLDCLSVILGVIFVVAEAELENTGFLTYLLKMLLLFYIASPPALDVIAKAALNILDI